MQILEKSKELATLLGIEISLKHHDEPVTVDNHGLIAHDHTRPWTLEIGFDKEWNSWFVALDRVTTAEVEAYFSALDMVGHRAVVRFQEPA